MNLILLSVIAVINAICALAFLVIIDLKTRILPNKYVLIFFLSGILFHLASSFHYLPPLHLLYGALVGGGILYGIRLAAERFYGPDSLGMGDVKLMAAAGVWLGPYHILLALSLGAMAGIVHGVGIVFWNRFRHDKIISFATLTLPAGPGFIFGVIVVALMQFWTFPDLVIK